ADGVFDGPGDGVGGDGDQAELEGDAEHHDVDELLGAESGLADFGEIFGVAVFFDAARVNFLAEALRVEVVLAEEGVNRRLFVHVEDGGGEIFGGDAELGARVGGAGGFEDVDAEEEVGAAVGDGACGGITLTPALSRSTGRGGGRVSYKCDLREDAAVADGQARSEEHTSELQSLAYLVCRLLLEKKKKKIKEYN